MSHESKRDMPVEVACAGYVRHVTHDEIADAVG